MSRVPYTIDVHRTVCSELELIRTMVKTGDYSSLLAVTERIQFHASSMEEGLYTYNTLRHICTRAVDDESLTDLEFREKVKKETDRLGLKKKDYSY